MQKVIHINDGWKFSDKFASKYLDTAFDAAECENVNLPHCAPWKNKSGKNKSGKDNVVTYFKNLDLSGHKAGSSFVLNFAGVMNYCEVYLNGIFVTSHFADTPFSADITAQSDLSKQNVLIIKVDAGKKAEVATGYGGYGGIYREISLTVRSPQFIRDCFIKTGQAASGEKVLNVDVELGDFYPDTMLSADVYDGDEQVAQLPEKTVLSRQVPLKGFVSGGKAWSPSSPTVYSLKIKLFSDAGELDVFEVNFGFVRSTFSRDSFYINGEPLKLIGIVRRDEYPLIYRAMPENLQREDARLIKRLGFNSVRTRGVPDVYFVEECDRLGVMIAVDLSAEEFIGEGRWREVYLDSLKETVAAFKNHPSIIAWGVRVNNSKDCNELYSKAVRSVKEIDSTRACFGSRHFMASHLYEDVFAYNDYNGGRTVTRQGKTSKLFVPYIISEHTGSTLPVKDGAGEFERTCQAMHHLSVTDKILRSKTSCGCFAEGLADYFNPYDEGEGEHIRFHGICDGYRNLKLSAYAYLSQTDEPVLQITTNFSHEYKGRTVCFTNGESVELEINGQPAGEYRPSKAFKGLKHPPVIIDNLMATVPAAKGISRFLLRRVVLLSDKKGFLSLRWYHRFTAFICRKLLKMDANNFAETVNSMLRRKLAHSVVTAKTNVGENSLTLSVGGGGEKLCVEAENFTKSRNTYSVIKINAVLKDGEGRTLRRSIPVWAAGSENLKLIGDTVSVTRDGTATFLFVADGEGEAEVSIGSNIGTEKVKFTL